MRTLTPAPQIAVAVLLCCATALAGQGPPPTEAIPTPATAKTCAVGHTALRAAAGGALGAWIGFVGAKIKLSDWSAESHTTSGQHTRLAATITGAAIGATVGALIHGGNSCGAHSGPMATQLSHRPITTEEIAQSSQTGSVYDLVYTLRRNWLNLRGTEALTEGPETFTIDGKEVTIVGTPRLIVYLDNAKLGTVDELRAIPVAGITGVRFFDGPEATLRWGAGHNHGAIQVVTTDAASTSSP